MAKLTETLRPCPDGTCSYPWFTPGGLQYSTAAGSLSAITAYSGWMSSLPSQNLELGRFVIGPLDPTNDILFAFFGNTNNATFNARVWGLDCLGPVYTGVGGDELTGFYVGELALVVGQRPAGGTGSRVRPADALYCDTITATTDVALAPGLLKFGAGTDCALGFKWDKLGHMFYVVECAKDGGTATAMGVTYRVL